MLLEAFIAVGNLTRFHSANYFLLTFVGGEDGQAGKRLTKSITNRERGRLADYNPIPRTKTTGKKSCLFARAGGGGGQGCVYQVVSLSTFYQKV